MAAYQLSAKELKTFNQGLEDCKNIKEDLERAASAGVPNMDHLIDAVTSCEERIKALKKHYAPKGK